MVGNEAEHGCAIVMEVKTGKIKAMANLGRRPDGSYFEDFNYALTPTEPGSTFKLATLIAALEDKKVNLNNTVNLEGGSWQIAGRTVWDSEQHGLYQVTIKKAFEESSNVGMAKLAVNGYGNNPSQFINHLKKLKLDETTGVDLLGEGKPVIYKPGSKYWSATTLPWMAFGYNLMVTPMHTAVLYNAVANNGKMLKPYLVSSVTENGKVVKEIQPVVLSEKICSDETLKQLNECLRGVCTEGTATSLFRNAPYAVAGKTGTALVANGNRGYADKIYQSSFAGFFPAGDPQYTIVVVVKNKPHAAKFYGASVAGPVFREISDRLYTLYVKQNEHMYTAASQKDTSWSQYTGYATEVKHVMDKLKISYAASSNTEMVIVASQNGKAAVYNMSIQHKQMPFLKGMSLKDAIAVCENIGLKVAVTGKGKVASQSVEPGNSIARGQLINIELR
jgi:cell division protein FtsI (penicillin-binding protein 3)